MLQVKTAPTAESVRQAASHTLFVEGSSPATLDPQLLSVLLEDTGVRVRPLGQSMSIRAVAEALHPHHPDYYFLVDRDHYDPQVVEKTWRDFPDQGNCHLVIWRLRELENYFLAPEYLSRSRYLVHDVAHLRDRIRKVAQKNLFWDAANMAIVAVRELIKQKWIETFGSTKGFETRNTSKALLRAMSEFGAKSRSVSQTLRRDRICRRFDHIVDELSGGLDELRFGSGAWLAMLRGKHILPSVVNCCFRVNDAQGRALQGIDRLTEVAKDLLRMPLAQQPEDFQALHGLIADRVSKQP